MTPEEITPNSILGTAIASVRTWVQWNCINGSNIQWGSDEILVPTLTIKDLEEIAMKIARDLWKEVQP